MWRSSPSTLERLRLYKRFTVNEALSITQWLERRIFEFTRAGTRPERRNGGRVTLRDASPSGEAE